MSFARVVILDLSARTYRPDDNCVVFARIVVDGVVDILFLGLITEPAYVTTS